MKKSKILVGLLLMTLTSSLFAAGFHCSYNVMAFGQDPNDTSLFYVQVTKNSAEDADFTNGSTVRTPIAQLSSSCLESIVSAYAKPDHFLCDSPAAFSGSADPKQGILSSNCSYVVAGQRPNGPIYEHKNLTVVEPEASASTYGWLEAMKKIDALTQEINRLKAGVQ